MKKIIVTVEVQLSVEVFVDADIETVVDELLCSFSDPTGKSAITHSTIKRRSYYDPTAKRPSGFHDDRWQSHS